MSPRVCVLHKDGTPLMPCKPAKARKLLRDGMAVKHWTREGVFYIQLTVDTSKHTQPMCLGIDPGSKFDGYVRFAHRRLALRWSYGCINRPRDCDLRNGDITRHQKEGRITQDTATGQKISQEQTT